jgi:hypothetical protein
MNPAKRLTCEQLLDHRYFDNYINDKSSEAKGSKNAQQAFNQSNGTIDRKSKQPGVSLIKFAIPY